LLRQQFANASEGIGSSLAFLYWADALPPRIG